MDAPEIFMMICVCIVVIMTGWLIGTNTAPVSETAKEISRRNAEVFVKNDLNLTDNFLIECANTYDEWLNVNCKIKSEKANFSIACKSDKFYTIGGCEAN